MAGREGSVSVSNACEPRAGRHGRPARRRGGDGSARERWDEARGDLHVVDNPDAGRYEIYSGTALAGFAEYRRDNEVTVFVHTEIDPALGGHDLGSALAKGALDDVRNRGRRIAVLCPFIAGYIAKHAEYRQLMALPDDRADT